MEETMLKKAEISNIRIMTAAFGSLIFFIFSVVIFAIASNMVGSFIYLILIPVFLVIIGVILTEIKRFYTTKLYITDKRVGGRFGLFNTNELNCPLNKVTGVQVLKTGFGKAFNFGTIVITTAANTFTFDIIKDPNEFKEFVLAQLS